MAIDDDTLARVRQALDASDRLDADRIHVEEHGDQVVLRGAVSSPEEASSAALLAEQQAPAVRNELRVDANLREGTGSAGTDPSDDLPEDSEAALGENLPWDPPDEPSAVPTPAEQRGVVDRDVGEVAPAGRGPVGGGEAPGEPEDGAPSAPDLTAAELARSARPRGEG